MKMEHELKLYSISDNYVEYLHKYDNHVLSNTDDTYRFSRKYLGIILEINRIKYFVPLASPKDSDYILESNGIKRVRKTIVPIMRITEITKNNGLVLLGKLKFSSMIPVPDSELSDYIIKDEKDTEYKNLVIKEWDFIRSNKSIILRNSKTIYNQKTKNIKGIGYLKSTVDFLLLEEKMKEYKTIEPESKVFITNLAESEELTNSEIIT